MDKIFFGNDNGSEIYLYTLKSDCAMAQIMTRGATLVRFVTYGVDIVGGFATLERYLEDTSHQGTLTLQEDTEDDDFDDWCDLDTWCELDDWSNTESY